MSAQTLVGPQPRYPNGLQKKMWLAASGVGLTVLIGCMAATQYVAWRYHFSSLLGPSLGGVYWPWAVFGWYARWHQLHPAVFEQAMSTGVAAAMVLLCGAALIALSRNQSKVNSTLHGSARWANERDLRRAGLLDNEGVYVGGWVRGGELHYLRHAGPEHILAYAPTRSGKGVGLVLPTLLSWPQSVVVVDLKRELWELTSGWRKEGAKNKVIRFEPAAASGSCGWNALDEIRIGTEHEIGDSQNLATLIVDPEGKGLRTHWEKTSQSMFVGCILYLCHRAQFGRGGEPATLPALDHLLADPARPVDKLWEAMKDHPHPVVAATGRDMLDRRGAEASDILSTAKSFLSSFRDPVIARNVSRSDFRIADLMNDDDPVSLYVVCEAKDQARLQVLVRILVNHVLRLLASGLEFEKGQPKPSYRHRLLLMLDEFPSLGKLDIMGKALATVATYGIKCYLIAQDLAQLRDQYGDNESITSNCHIQIAFPPNRLETAEHLSRLTGQATVIKEQVSRTGRGFSSSVSRTLQEVQRPLLTPDECLRMPGPVKDAQGLIREPGDMVVYAAGFPACYGRQPLYFADPVFKARAAVPAPKESDALRAGPLPFPASAMIDL